MQANLTAFELYLNFKMKNSVERWKIKVVLFGTGKLPKLIHKFHTNPIKILIEPFFA